MNFISDFMIPQISLFILLLLVLDPKYQESKRVQLNEEEEAAQPIKFEI